MSSSPIQSEPVAAFTRIKVRPIADTFGAEIGGVDLSERLDQDTLDEIARTFLAHGVIAFRDQNLDHFQHKAFARHFGPLEVHPIVNGLENHPEVIAMRKPAGESASFGVGWHSDNSFLAEPSLGSVVYAEIIPPSGGDTLFADQAAAYEALPEGMKRLLDGLTAIHSAHDAYTSPSAEPKYEGKTAITFRRSDAIDNVVEHPVICTHPSTGRKALYVNPMFTQNFKDMSREESAPLLDYLFTHASQPEFQCRFQWQPGSVAFWDNRRVMHNALDDYQDFERLLYRVTVQGERPY